jgi:hypothetical protein
MCCFSVCFFKARLLRMRGGAVGFSATAFIERRRPSVQERCVRKESVGRIVFCHTLKAMWQRGWLGIFASLQKEKAGKGEKILPRGVVAASKLLLLPDIDRGSGQCLSL